MKYQKNNLLIANLWVSTLILYLFRSIFVPLHYLAYASFGILVFVYSFYFIKHFGEIKLIPFLSSIKVLILLSFLIVWGIIITEGFSFVPMKELLNFIVVLFFVFTYIYMDVDWKKFLKQWLLFSFIIGTIAILAWLNSILSLNCEVLNVISKYKASLNSISLTKDYNFYSLHFILSIILLYFAIYYKIINYRFCYSQIFLWIYILNIALSNSRRGMLVFIILILFASFYVLYSYKRFGSFKQFYKSITRPLLSILIIFIIIILVFPFRTILISKEKTRDKITLPVYRYSTLFNNNIPYVNVKEKLWPKNRSYFENELNKKENHLSKVDYFKNIWFSFKSDNEDYWSSFIDQSFPDNLIYNGDLSNNLIFWDKIIPEKDSVVHSLIETEFGNAIRVERIKGVGFWPLAYKGRSINYYKGITYTFKFKFRIISGEISSFNIGWWIKDDGKYIHNIKKEIRKINSNWFECSCSYTFKGNYQGEFATFMNSQKAGTVIDIANIQLYSNDTLIRPKYFDQIQALPNTDNKNNLRESRIVRWQYAYALFMNYPVKEKIIGNGFNYIYPFDQKFAHQNLSIEEIKEKGYFDYPHNPIISAFLYSGIVGGLFNIYFVLLTIWHYWKSRKSLGLFFILYGISLFFVFFSGNTFFSVPIFIILSIIPFIQKHKKTSLIQIEDSDKNK